MTEKRASDEASLKRLVGELRDLLVAMDDQVWSRTMDSILRRLDGPGDINGAGLLYFSIIGGAGSFDDFVYWCDDFDKRRVLNEKLSGLRSRIYEIFEQSRKAQDLPGSTQGGRS